MNSTNTEEADDTSGPVMHNQEAFMVQKPIPQPPLWMWLRHPVYAFRLHTLHGILENEQFLRKHDVQFGKASPGEIRAEAYRFMNLQRNILWIVRFFVLAAAGVAYYLLTKYGQ